VNIEIASVSVAIQGKRIVEGISLHIQPGQIVGLIGPNGSGKSTLLRTVYRMLKPEAGYVRLGGDDVWKLTARESARRTGVVVQETPSDFEFTVREVVQMGRTPHKDAFTLDTQADAALVSSALARVEMIGFDERLFSTLSGGEKQRVLIARVLAQQPKLLILDEPTNHLDVHHQLEILELVRGLGITTLITLHDLNLAAMYCDYLYVMQQGQIAAEGEPEATLTRALIQQVFRVDAIHTRHPSRDCLHLIFIPLEQSPPPPA
jgi:iron complex transport system ATP-binding protein